MQAYAKNIVMPEFRSGAQSPELPISYQMSQAERMPDIIPDVYASVAAKAAARPLPFTEILAELGEEPLAANIERGVLWHMASRDARGLGAGFGTAYFLDYGCVYNKNRHTEKSARTELRNTVVMPAMLNLQAVIDTITAHMEQPDLSRLEPLADQLHTAAAEWSALRYPFSSEPANGRSLQDVYAETVRLSGPRPVLEIESRAIARLWFFDKKASRDVFYALIRDSIDIRSGIPRRTLYLPELQCKVLYDPILHAEDARERAGQDIADARLLQQQMHAIGQGLEQRFSNYLAQVDHGTNGQY